MQRPNNDSVNTPGKLLCPVAVFFSLLFMLLPLPESAMAAPINVTVNSMIVPDPCEVSLGGGDMSSGRISFADLESSDLSEPGQSSPSMSFNIQLSNCGNDYGSTQPTITVTGTTVGVVSPDTFLFRGANSDAENLGFIFRFNSTSVTWGGGSDKNIENGSSFGVAQFPSDWKNGVIPVAVAVSSGDSETVNGKGRAGLLEASVTFAFDYK